MRPDPKPKRADARRNGVEALKALWDIAPAPARERPPADVKTDIYAVPAKRRIPERFER